MAEESLVPATEQQREHEPMVQTVTLEQETNPWQAQAVRFDFAAKKLNLDQGIWKVLRYPTREIIVHIPVSMDDGSIEVFTGYRVQHSIARGMPNPLSTATTIARMWALSSATMIFKDENWPLMISP